MTAQANKLLLRDLFEAVNEGNFDALEGHPGFWETRQVVPPAHALFADWRTAHLQQIAEDHKVFSYATIQMTQVGSFAGVVPTQRRVTIEGFFLDQVQAGVVVEHNGTTSWPDVVRQLGSPAFQAIPAREPRLLAQQAYGSLAAPEPNKAIVARLLQGLSQGDRAVAAPHDGIGQLQEEFEAIGNAFSDLRYTTVMQVAEGDLVGTRATLSGTHTGELFGFAATGGAISWDYFSLARVADGAVVEYNGSADWTAALLHLGLLPLG